MKIYLKPLAPEKEMWTRDCLPEHLLTYMEQKKSLGELEVKLLKDLILRLKNVEKELQDIHAIWETIYEANPANLEELTDNAYQQALSNAGINDTSMDNILLMFSDFKHILEERTKSE